MLGDCQTTSATEVDTIEIYGKPIPVASFTNVLIGFDEEQRIRTLVALAKEETVAASFFQHPAFLKILANQDEAIAHSFIAAMPETVQEYLRTKALTIGLDFQVGLKITKYMGTFSNSVARDAAIEKIVLIKGEQDETTAKKKPKPPEDYPADLAKFFAQHYGKSLSLILKATAAKAVAENTPTGDEKIKAVARASKWGLALHVAANPDDFYFNALPVVLFMPVLTGQPNDDNVVRSLLNVRANYEDRQMRRKFADLTKAGVTTDSVLECNFFVILHGMKVAACLAIAQENMEAYSAIQDFYIQGLTSVKTATYGEFKAFFERFYDYACENITGFPRAVFTEHDDLSNTTSMNAERRHAEQRTRTDEALRNMGDAIQGLQAEALTTGDPDQVDLAGKMAQAQLLLAEATKALRAGQKEESARYYNAWKILAADIKGEKETLVAKLDAEQDALIAELQKGGVTPERKAEIIARVTEIGAELEALQ